MKKIAKDFKNIRVGDKDLKFEIRYSKKRKKSIALSIYSSKSLVVSVPNKTQEWEINDFILSKSSWIKDKLEYFDNLDVKQLKYIENEIHKYLGNEYILTVVPSNKDAVKIENNKLIVYNSRTHNIFSTKTILTTWYYNQALKDILEYGYTLFNRFNIYCLTTPIITLKKMRSRWGSCDTKGNISINIDLIKTHKKCIEYVLVHEFCHLKQHNHGKRFYKLLNEHMPDWKK